MNIHEKNIAEAMERATINLLQTENNNISNSLSEAGFPNLIVHLWIPPGEIMLMIEGKDYNTVFNATNFMMQHIFKDAQNQIVTSNEVTIASLLVSMWDDYNIANMVSSAHLNMRQN